MFRQLLGIIALALAATPANAITPAKTWFMPILKESHSPICEDALKRLNTQFLSEERLESTPWGKALPEPTSPDELPEEQEQKFITLTGKVFYIYDVTHGGCGGACELHQTLLLPDAKIDNQNMRLYSLADKTNAPPKSKSSYLFSSEQGGIYLASYGAEWNNAEILLHEFKTEGRWQFSCRFQIAPDTLNNPSDSRLVEPVEAIGQLKSALATVRGGSGWCGSMGTHGRLGARMTQAFDEALYRPWGLVDDEYDPNRKIQESLKDWSRGGIHQYTAYQNYLTQFSMTERRLSQFYQENFGWPQQNADAMAKLALDTAIARGFQFSGDTPGDEALRQALMNLRPLEEVTKQYESASVPRTHEYMDWPIADPLLHVAVKHSEALAYLLSQGEDPEALNPFGKTALMQAAQYNQLESARLLLDKGADPNAATVWPQDRCYYTLTSTNVTPLHYAVRYGSRELIELLLSRGANTFTKASVNGQQETPLIWLRRYTAPGVDEKNPNLSTADIDALTKALEPPSPEQLDQKARQLTIEAEREYQQGQLDSGYRKLKAVLNIAPKNERALADMSLLAYKSKRFGESLQASQALLTTSKDNKILANAWFNQGLACNDKELRGSDRLYNHHHFCQQGQLFPFLQAYVTAPTDTRRDKLLSMLTSHPSCELASGEKTTEAKITITPAQNPATESFSPIYFIYVLSKSGNSPSVDDIQWHASSKPDSAIVHPELWGKYRLAERELNVFATTESLPTTISIFGKACTRD